MKYCNIWYVWAGVTGVVIKFWSWQIVGVWSWLMLDDDVGWDEDDKPGSDEDDEVSWDGTWNVWGICNFD